MNSEMVEVRRQLRELTWRMYKLEHGFERVQRLIAPDSPLEPDAPADADDSPPVAPPAPGPAPQFVGPPDVQAPPTPPATPPGRTPRAVPPTVRRSEVVRHPIDRSSLELQIGSRWVAWTGAILVVVAVSFFVQLVVEQGWLARISPAWRCMIAAAFGCMLLGAGELALRRIGRAAAVGLYSAGLGTLYVTAYAACRIAHLIPDTVAFALLALVAALGLALTLRGGLLTIGVLSLLGGYGAPLLLARPDAPIWVLPIYLSLLLAVALGLNQVRPQPFARLRPVAMALQALLGGVWAVDKAREFWLLVLIFLAVWWLMVQIDAALAALRQRSANANALTSFLATAWFAGVGCWVLSWAYPGGTRPLGLLILVIAIETGVYATWFGPGLLGLRALRHEAVDKLSISLWLQTGILLATAIGLYFNQPGLHGIGQSICWLALALGCVELGRRLPSAGTTLFGLTVLSLAVGRVVLVDRRLDALDASLVSWPWLKLTGWGLLALGATLVTFVAGRRIHLFTDRESNSAGVVLTVVGASLWLLLVAEQCVGIAIGYGWLAGAAALLLLERLVRTRGYLETAIGLLVLVAARSMLVDAGLPRVQPGWDPWARRLVLNPALLLGLLAAAAFWWSARIVSRREAAAMTASSASAAAFSLGVGNLLRLVCVAVVLVSLSFEIDRAVAQDVLARGPWPDAQVRVLWLPLLWGAAGLGLFIGVRSPRLQPLQQAGKLLVVASMLAWLVPGSLAPRIEANPVSVTMVLNLQFAAGLLLAAMLAALARLTWMRGRAANAGAVIPDVERLLLLGVAAALIAVSLEADRAVTLHPSSVWQTSHLRTLWLALVWGVGGAAVLWGVRRSVFHDTRRAGWVCLLGSLIVWLTWGTVLPRAMHGPTPAPIVLNVQFLFGLALAALAALAVVVSRRTPTPWPELPAIAAALALTIGLWLGSLELDRWFAQLAWGTTETRMATRSALSVFWSLYAIALVGAGLRWRCAWLRYAGLALLAIALLKVAILDLAGAQPVYRVVSFLGLGLVMILTSVIYARLAARLVSGRSPGATAV